MKFLYAIGLLVLCLAQSAMAERADRKKPMHLEADRATVEDVNRKESSRITVFTGNVAGAPRG